MKKIFTLIVTVLALYGCTASDGVNGGQAPDPHLRLFSIVPATGEVGSAAIISGINFTDAVVVKVGEAVAEKVSVSANRIQITLPANAPGTYPITLTKGEETASGTDYTYVEDGKAPMTLVNMVPAAGYAGTETVIYGQGFGDDTSALHVYFDDAEGQVLSSTRNIIHVKAPEHIEGDAFVTVKSASQEGGTLRFTYKHEPVFQLLEIAPTSGKAGSTAVITGELFSPVPEENIVTINGVQAEVVAATSEKLTITLPQNPEGTYSIHLKVGDKETEGLSFTYLPKAWIINYFVGNGKNENVKDGIGAAASVHCVQDIHQHPSDPNKLWMVIRGKHSIMTLDKTTGEAKTLVTNDVILNNLWQGEFNSKGVFYVAVKAKNQIATITQEGVAMTYAILNEDGTPATTTGPMDLCFDGDNTMFIACRDLPVDGTKGAILKVVDGKVKATWSAPNIGTLQMGPDKKLYWGRDGQLDGQMYLNRTDPSTGESERIAGNGTVANATTFTNGEAGKPLTATINVTRDIFFCADGAMLITEQGTGTLRKLTPDESGDYAKGTFTTIAGTPWVTSGTAAGSYDGFPALGASLSMYVYGVWAEPDMSAIYLADGFNYRVNKLVMED